LKNLIYNLKLNNIILNENMQENLKKYTRILLEYNKKINLTSIILPEEIYIKHFFDSLILNKYINFNNKKVIDIGTGAGFPGVPLKIFDSSINLFLLDSLKKRLKFLEILLKELNLKAEIIDSRAESGSKDLNLREKFGIVIARAVASLPVLLEYCLPYVELNGIFIAMKGLNIQEELKNSENIIKILGGELESIKNFNLPDNSARNLIIIKKIKNTPEKFPRSIKNIKEKKLF